MHEFLEIYHKTGMDIDGRIWFVKQSYPEMEESCLKYIHYAQELPGFDKFVKEDQISILKGIVTSTYYLKNVYLSLTVTQRIGEMMFCASRDNRVFPILVLKLVEFI